MDPRNGGPCQGIRNLQPQVLQHGGSVEVVCLDDSRADYLARESVKIHALGRGRSSWSYHPALVPWLKENLPRFDAVILNGLWQYPGYALAKLKAQHPDLPPYFVFPHGMLDPWFQRAPERRWKAIRNWFYWKLTEQHVIRRANALFFTCAEELRLARETFRPYQPQREINVGYGIAAPPPFHDHMMPAFVAKCPELSGRPYILFLSRIHPKKGIDLLIKAYARVYTKSQLLSPDSHSQIPALVIAGPGLDTEYGLELQRLARSLCPQPSSLICWPGMLTGDAKWGALYGCEAFALPSHQENFGIAVAEALACAKPVLISNQVNIWREIEAAGGGIVADDTLVGTEASLHRWHTLNAAARTAMSTAAFTCYSERFSVVNSGKTFVETLQRQLVAPRPINTVKAAQR